MALNIHTSSFQRFLAREGDKYCEPRWEKNIPLISILRF